MKSISIGKTLGALAVLTGAAFSFSCNEPPKEGAEPTRAKVARVTPNVAESKSTHPTQAERVRLGEHLVSTAGCHDCHTPWTVGPKGPAPDMTRALSGHPESFVLPPAPPASGPWIVSVAATNTAYSGPWGTSFTANLTPDKETGLGAWSEQNFVRTIRTGRHMGQGRPVLPPMPVPVYQNFSDDELKAIFAYLGSIPAIKNRVPTPRPPVDAAGSPS